jgi:ribose 5-phosphate isomerase B
MAHRETGHFGDFAGALSLLCYVSGGDMKIGIGSDHAGFEYKERIKLLLRELGHDVRDFGTDSPKEPVDYPNYIRPVAEAVARGEFERGIVLGGSGNGEAIVANRVRGVRCTLCWNLESARLGREHNDGNVLSLGQRMLSLELALEIVKVWLTTPFAGGRHERRIQEIDEV